tara:strand:+ start:33 stop:596 length:564 start_codon:yes stop_codon:yes gene_type:complete
MDSVAIKKKELKPAVFLDRDGVINVDFGHVGDPSKIVYVEDSLQSIKLFNELGFRVFVVTNQAGIGKGLYSEEDYLACMERILSDLNDIGAFYDDIRFCPYHSEAVVSKYCVDNHFWRKPNPGMILDIMLDWNTKVSDSFIIGDKQSDIAAAQEAGLKGYLFNQMDNLLDFVKDIPEIKERLNLLQV